jgi:uncharacterized protein (DUF1778 family)
MTTRNAVLTGLAAACLLFIGLILATRLPLLVALVIAIFGGGMVLAAATSKRRSTQSAVPAYIPVAAPAAPPVQFETRPVTGVWLPSALADYPFAFAANVVWLPAADGVIGPGEIAVHEIIRRAREITARRDPSQVTLIEPELAAALGVLLHDPDRQVQVRAESVKLRLPPEDQQRLDEAATLRKQEGLWEYKRRQEVSKRRYLHTDVLKDSGSAVVWWLAKNEEQPQQVAENIDVLTRLAHAANNTGDAPPDSPAGPRTSVDHFDAFLDALDPAPSDDQRLMLANQVARHIDGVDPKTAEEMRRRYSETDGGDGYWDYPKADGMPPA